jgi:hypothetical protein
LAYSFFGFITFINLKIDKEDKDTFNIELTIAGPEVPAINFLFAIGLRFSAEKSLWSDSTYNELLIINLATVRAEGILIPVLHKCVP